MESPNHQRVTHYTISIYIDIAHINTIFEDKLG